MQKPTEKPLKLFPWYFCVREMKYGISGRMYSTWNKVFLVHCAVIIYNKEQLQQGVDKCHIFLILVVFLSAQSSTVSMAQG